MKRLLAFLTVLVFCLAGFSQEPESFNYQAIIHNTAGEVAATHVLTCKISILAGNPYDTIVYSERQVAATNKDGLLTLSIGNGSDKTGNFTSIDWSSEKYFLKVEIDSSSGHKYIDPGITQIMIVPGAFPGSAAKEAPEIIEDKLFISRKYVGTFLDYRQTGPNTYNGPNILWIKTSLSETYGKISAYGKKCKFSIGDKLYLRRTYYSPGEVTGFWEYWIENDSSIYYRATDFQHDHKYFLENWFN
jgi:hypothetical protein